MGIKNSKKSFNQIKIIGQTNNVFNSFYDDAQKEQKQKILENIVGAKKIHDFGTFLKEKEESYYLQPKDLYKYIGNFFEQLYQESYENPLLLKEEKDDKETITIPKILLGEVNNHEYYIDINRKNNLMNQSKIYNISFSKRDRLGKIHEINKVYIDREKATSTKTTSSEDKIMFKGLLKILEVELGNLSHDYYKIAK